jgi:hypothetical protein
MNSHGTHPWLGVSNDTLESGSGEAVRGRRMMGEVLSFYLLLVHLGGSGTLEHGRCVPTRVHKYVFIGAMPHWL